MVVFLTLLLSGVIACCGQWPEGQYRGSGLGQANVSGACIPENWGVVEGKVTGVGQVKGWKKGTQHLKSC